jgi:hypothetical protein
VARNLLVVEMPDAGDERSVAALFRPSDGFPLGVAGFEHVAGAVFDDIAK